MPYNKKTGYLNAKVTATAHAGTEFSYTETYEDWTHNWRQKGDQLVIDVMSGHGGPEAFRFQMLDEEAAAKAISLIEKHSEIDIQFLQPSSEESLRGNNE